AGGGVRKRSSHELIGPGARASRPRAPGNHAGESPRSRDTHAPCAPKGALPQADNVRKGHAGSRRGLSQWPMRRGLEVLVIRLALSVPVGVEVLSGPDPDRTDFERLGMPVTEGHIAHLAVAGNRERQVTPPTEHASGGIQRARSAEMLPAGEDALV